MTRLAPALLPDIVRALDLSNLLVNRGMLVTLQLLYASLALAGVLISAWVGWDCQRDLWARKRRGVNGELARLARVNRRDAARVNGPLHLVMLSLGLLGLAASRPLAYQMLLVNEVFAVVFIAVQASVVQAQVQNQVERISLRRRSRRTASGRKP